MERLGRNLLFTIGAITGGIGAGFAISRFLRRRTEKKIGGKLMHVHYRFSKDFDQ